MNEYKFTVTQQGKKFLHQVKNQDGQTVKKRLSKKEYYFTTVNVHPEDIDKPVFTFGCKPSGTPYHSTYKITQVLSR